MVQIERANLVRFDQIDECTVQHMAELKMPLLLKKRPRVLGNDGLKNAHRVGQWSLLLQHNVVEIASQRGARLRGELDYLSSRFMWINASAN